MQSEEIISNDNASNNNYDYDYGNDYDNDHDNDQDNDHGNGNDNDNGNDYGNNHGNPADDNCSTISKRSNGSEVWNFFRKVIWQKEKK